ncbi:PREDICTED: uncharacterized protein LOC108355009, partial [Rhagoletis zephyria]|uniref:uncharacterized protein LOC108355009 n=1 Tax=Rhagoletis zephyria TaxID=28612 RepID=UPI00081150D2
VRIEACLNSRPIIALHDDPEGGVALSPGDFLIGRPLNSRPEATVPEAPDNRLKYYQRLQRMLQHFWHRWKEEYLVQLQSRSKWARPTPNLQVGDVVAIQQEQLPPSRWRIGRITAVLPGSDGLVRVVTIESCTFERGFCRKHLCQRPVQRLCRILQAHEGILSPEDLAGEDVRD